MVQQSNPRFAGPCFHPRLFQIVGRCFPGVRVAVIESSEGVGFLPFRKQDSHPVMSPVPMCDYQALIDRPGIRRHIPSILSQLGYVAWDFEHLMAEGLEPAPSHLGNATHSRQIFVGESYEAYLRDLKAHGKSQKNLATKRRLLERDVGLVRFVQKTADSLLLRPIFEWKRQRFGSLSQGIQRTMEETLHTEEEGFASTLSALYAGEKLVAVHFGMKGDNTLFYWLPAFNPECYKFSPGGLLIQELTAHIHGFEASTLDLGPGGETYKDYFCNRTVDLLRGSYELPSGIIYLRQFKRSLYQAVRSTPLAYRAAQSIARTTRTLRKAVGK